MQDTVTYTPEVIQNILPPNHLVLPRATADCARCFSSHILRVAS